jgi:vacuolar-type H+-ATPase subunit I/STV1
MSKASSTEIEAMRSAVADAQAAVETAVEDFNGAMTVARASLDEAIVNYNEALAELKGRLESEQDAHQQEYDEKSERWQESDRGNAASEWIDAIGNAASALDAELDMTGLPGPADSFDFADLDEVESLPDAPDEV